MIKQASRNGVTFFATTKTSFARMKERGELSPFRIYFVGDANVEAKGFANSEKGEIHVAVTNERSVRFVNLTSQDLEKGLDELKKELKDYIQDVYTDIYTDIDETERKDGVIRFYPQYDSFPSVGESNCLCLYYAGDTNKLYSYDEDEGEYVEVTGDGGVQSDWNQADTTAIDYIKNKPTAMVNPYSFAIGGKTYDGSAAVSVSLTDLDVYSKSESDGRFVKQHANGSPTGDIVIPVYIDGLGRVATCYKYAGGTQLTLNGIQLIGEHRTCYAPIDAGLAGQYLTPAINHPYYPYPDWETPDSTPTQSSTKLITSDAVYQALLALALSDTAVAGKFITKVDETAGVVSVTRGGTETLNSVSLYEVSLVSDDLNVIVGFGGNNADKTFKKMNIEPFIRLINERTNKDGLLTVNDQNWRMYLKKWSGNPADFDEWSDTASEPYECNVLVIPNSDIHTVKIETTAMIDPTQGYPTPIKLERIVMPSGSFETLNRYRITMFGNWQPSTNGYWGMSNADGRFSNYVYTYRYGVGGSSATGCMWEAFEEFIYFNGVWYSKAY